MILICGIAGIYVKERGRGDLPVGDLLDYLLLNIQSRGQDATGFLTVQFPEDGGELRLEKAPVPADRMIAYRRYVDDERTQIVLAHTRFATQGHQNVNDNNHPVVWDKCYAIHNGHINNDTSVLEELGIKDRGEADVDSIAIAAALAHHGIDTDESIIKALEMLEGSMATAIVSPETNPGRLVLAKGSGSPMYIFNTRYAILWASTLEALKNSWGWCIGTPPNAKAEDASRRGVYEAKYGEAWVVEGDEVRKIRFKPKTTYYSSSNYVYSDTYFGLGMGGRRDSWDRPNRIRRWTCTPTSLKCTSPCEGGCMTVNTCECVVWRVWDPFLRAYVDEDSAVPDVVGARVRCESCWDWYDDTDVVEAQMGSEHIPVCLDCATADGWLETRPSRTVVKDENEVEDEVQAAHETLEHYQAVAEFENERHKTACEVVAKEVGSNPEFVQWILFEASLDDLDKNDVLRGMRNVIDLAYDKAYNVSS